MICQIYFQFINRLDRIVWLIILTFASVIILEYTTPPEYVFGYLYTGTILLANHNLSTKTIWRVTLSAIALTIFNLFFPNLEPHNPATIANRLIAVMALAVTGWLSIRNRYSEEAVARSQAQLRTQQQLAILREDFVSTLTHDLKTPLLGAIETINAFQNGQFGAITPTQAKVLTMMSNSHRSSLELVQTLLDVYRNDIEGIQLKRETIDLSAIASEVIANLTNLATTRQVYLFLTHNESNFRSRFFVNGDALQLQRVFNNLIVNGINHSPRNGKVEIHLASDGEFHVIKVLDSGKGISSTELPHLFERFYQGGNDSSKDNFSARASTGSGLGLYLARQIIYAHGGTIWAENRLPQGAMFGFRLPAIAE
ncbi:integral membrane sensor signal transduction histidine kinase [Stanieria cyanosphaera PCC 7437]|uniref:histidine kinase n=1 Tax=Stanieria cyanosphaera (strain ATCC 29371 / PCC 7437) TaxID=111780 RepID=K9Y0L7_STAC7|nr:HAMP domain-containing sensor histidine kinase [Stanieria cyanosphaera]AFZ37482.1 integral membrane sensor signal transduction histidine kinase [Stanieria cyanosphaera PCC 7437]